VAFGVRHRRGGHARRRRVVGPGATARHHREGRRAVPSRLDVGRRADRCATGLSRAQPHRRADVRKFRAAWGRWRYHWPPHRGT
jgi:hypothetical protein